MKKKIKLENTSNTVIIMVIAFVCFIIVAIVAAAVSLGVKKLISIEIEYWCFFFAGIIFSIFCSGLAEIRREKKEKKNNSN